MPVEYKVTRFDITWDHPTPTTDSATSKTLWCRGVQIDAEINVTKYQPQTNRKYEVGLVQTLDYSNQKALYKLKLARTADEKLQTGALKRLKIISWGQKHLPVFDGDPGEKLFYDAASRKTITGTGTYSVQLRDYPTLQANKTDNDTNNNAYNLIRAIKYNKFHVFLIVRRSESANIQDGIWCDYLRDVEWSTKVEAAFDPANNFNVLKEYQDKSSSILPLQHLTVLSPIRRNLNLHKGNVANGDQKVATYMDFLGVREFTDFTVDRYMPTIAV